MLGRTRCRALQERGPWIWGNCTRTCRTGSRTTQEFRDFAAAISGLGLHCHRGDQRPVVPVPLGISCRDLILLGGGLFLIGKSVYEIHHKLEGTAQEKTDGQGGRFGWALAQIVVLDA
jgi:hypothetical protein